MACFGVDGKAAPSRLTFVVNPDCILSPQTGHPWYVEMDHEMGNMRMYSLVPKENNNQYTHHYYVEERLPRFIGKFAFTGAWMSSRHFIREIGDIHVHYSENLYNPLRAGDNLFFDRKPQPRIEVTAPRFLDDREVLDVLEMMAPTGCQIASLLQRRS